MVLVACMFILGIMACLFASFAEARDRKYLNASGWLVAAVVCFAMATGSMLLDIEMKVSECRTALATKNAERTVDGRPKIPDTCEENPDAR